MPRRPTRWAARMSERTSSPTIAMSARARSRPTSRRRSAMATEKNSGWGLPTMRARVSVANSRPATKAPESSVGPSGVSHHGFWCMPTSFAPPRTRRNARFMLSNVTSSGESPMTTAAAVAPRAPASSWVSRRWPANSLWRPRDASTYSGASGKWRAVHAADADRADWNRDGRDRRPDLPRPASQRRPADGRGVGHDPVGERRALERGDRLGRARDGLAGHDDHAVEVEQERAHAVERLP